MCRGLVVVTCGWLIDLPPGAQARTAAVEDAAIVQLQLDAVPRVIE
jgi:hypothetical protein